MRFGAHFLPEDLPVFLDSVRAADAAGYDYAWLVDGQMLWQDVYVYMTHGLAATERLVFGVAVTNPLTRHPSVTASVNATLADLHPGRVVLGLGRGDNAVRTLGLKPVPTAELADAVPRIRALMAGEAATLGGHETRIRWADEQVPILMAATGPKNLRLCGALRRHRDGLRRHAPGERGVGDRPRPGRRRGGGARPRRRRHLGALRHVGRRRPGARPRRVPLGAAACANHIAYALKWNPDHGMPERMTRLVRRATATTTTRATSTRAPSTPRT